MRKDKVMASRGETQGVNCDIGGVFCMNAADQNGEEQHKTDSRVPPFTWQKTPHSLIISPAHVSGRRPTLPGKFKQDDQPMTKQLF
ncbi:MAG: hypothetical protein ABW007_22385 [Chitinophagaceae bacterium]